MTVRNLNYVFKPKTVALLGAGNSPQSIGSVVASNLLDDAFCGHVFLVNPIHDRIGGHRCYPNVASLPAVPELAVLSVQASIVPRVIDDLGRLGTKGVIVITAGYGERSNGSGERWKKAILESAQPYNLRVVGPNCLGVIVPGHCLNGSFGHVSALAGNLAFVAQSGAVLTSVLDWATWRGIGFTHLVSLGDMIDVDFGDMLNYLAADAPTRAILLYIESVTNARKFMSAARAAARMKPVIVMKAGRFAESGAAAFSHTGALQGVDTVYDAAFRRAGVLRVMDMEALFAAVETLAVAGPFGASGWQS